MSIVPTVVRAMERVAPLRLAEKWDNVGLLVESPLTRPHARRVLLTIDLSPAVLEEALSTPATSMIISYHPPIFRPLASLTMAVPLQSSLLRCAAAGISVFSPHTALDNVTGGINDWLAQGLTGLEGAIVRPIEPREDNVQAGAGRILTYQEGVPLRSVVDSVKAHLGLKYIQLASPLKVKSSIKSVAICAGSGGTLLQNVESDVYLTGEMAHHEVLAAVARGVNVILCGHDNTERGYLPTLRDKLQDSLSVEPGGRFEVIVSTRDRHPLEII